MTSNSLLSLIEIAYHEFIQEAYNKSTCDKLQVALNEFSDYNQHLLEMMVDEPKGETTASNKTVPNDVLHQATVEYLKKF